MHFLPIGNLIRKYNDQIYGSFVLGKISIKFHTKKKKLQIFIKVACLLGFRPIPAVMLISKCPPKPKLSMYGISFCDYLLLCMCRHFSSPRPSIIIRHNRYTFVLFRLRTADSTLVRVTMATHSGPGRNQSAPKLIFGDLFLFNSLLDQLNCNTLRNTSVKYLIPVSTTRE